MTNDQCNRCKYAPIPGSYSTNSGDDLPVWDCEKLTDPKMPFTMDSDTDCPCFEPIEFSWDDIVNEVMELIAINVIDTMSYDDHYTVNDISTVMTSEYDMIKENLDEYIYREWDSIYERIKEQLKEE